mgnify:CR=1 FL=1|tara:strand:- start:1937 stop:2617 length:681 start_codon:yes stop_codon:yes gene_type:complete
MSNLISEYIKRSSKLIKENREVHLYNRIPFHVKDPFVEDIDLNHVTQKIESIIPFDLVSSIDSVYIGQFDHLNSRNVNAAYHEGAIYLTNVQDDEDDMIDDIVHEMAHAVEEQRGMDIYMDGELEREFLGKRARLAGLLQAEGYKVPLDAAMSPDYDQGFDEFLYQEVGYPVLTTLTMGLFYSPYAATSLREYFANGFEAVFLHNEAHYLKKISPRLFSKLDDLTE